MSATNAVNDLLPQRRVHRFVKMLCAKANTFDHAVVKQSRPEHGAFRFEIVKRGHYRRSP